MRRSAYLPVTLVLVLAGIVAALGLVVPALWAFPAPREEIDDPRACAGSDVELAEVAEHFAVVLPDDATEVRFRSGFNSFFGEYSLTVLFRTTPEGLRSFILDSGFAQPAVVDSTTVVTSAVCPGPLHVRRGLVAEMQPRRLVVETSDAEHPLVYVEAIEL